MKNKKGFTLIELLAVIVILAVIMVIAVPKVLNIIENSEKKSYENSVNLMVEAARLKYQTGNIKGENIQLPLSYIYEDNKQTNIEEVGELVFKGDKPFSGTITITEEGKIVVENLVSKNKKWCALKEQNNAEAKVGDASELGCAIEEVDNDNYLIKATSSNASDPYLNGPIKKEEIESIKFERSKKVPSDAIKSWDVSEKQNKSIMAWYKDEDNNSKYELYIGQNGGVKANPVSSYLFSSLTNLTNIDLSNFDTTNVTDMRYMFADCRSLTSLNVSNFDTSKVEDMRYMFSSCSSLKNLNLGEKFDTSKVTSMEAMFNGCSSLTSLNVSNFDTTNVTDMRSMFDNCSSLTSLNVSNFDTSNVKNVGSMFCNCSSLTSLDLGDKFDTSKVIYTSHMFYNCSLLTNLDLENKFDTSNVITMEEMFYNCSSLTSLDLGDKFDTSEVKGMNSMFNKCSSLTSLNLGEKFNTSKVTNMEGMFFSCSSLTNLNLGDKFDTTKVANMAYMFANCSKLTTEITIKNPNVTSYSIMFNKAATETGSKITVNYTAKTSNLVTNMVNTKSENSNIVKGKQL